MPYNHCIQGRSIVTTHVEAFHGRNMNGATPLEEQPKGNEGVLLYYKYVNLGEEERASAKEWYTRECLREELRGRVRVALDGVNCTLGGDFRALQRHVSSVRAHGTIQGDDIDFKLSSSRGARNPQAAMESGFTTLSVKAVKEVVSMGKRGKELSPQQGGKHVSPREFHEMLRLEARRSDRRTHAGERTEPRADNAVKPVMEVWTENKSEDNGSHDEVSNECASEDERAEEKRKGEAGPEGKADCSEDRIVLERQRESVLLDVRNVYETSIGNFSADGVETLDPKTRQFSDFPKWVDDNIHRLRGKRVLMYCTGGVRCEKASALIRQGCNATTTSPADNTEIFQLAGGIERYLQMFPSDITGVTLKGGGSTDASLKQDAERRGEGVRQGMPAGEDASGTALVQGDSSCERYEGTHEGFFRGKNFVFDERVSVPDIPAGGLVVGRCLCCERPWDDYGNRSRCERCRMLVLLCDNCVDSRMSPKSVLLSTSIPCDSRLDAGVRDDEFCGEHKPSDSDRAACQRVAEVAEVTEATGLSLSEGRTYYDLLCSSCRERSLG